MLRAPRAGKADRLTPAGSRPHGETAPFFVFLAAGLLLHVSLIAAGLLWESLRSPPPSPEPEPIAVELVEEPPQPEPAPEEVKQEPPPAAEEAKQEPPPAPEEQPKAEPEPEAEKAELPPVVPLDVAPAFDAPKSARNDTELTIGDNSSGPPSIAAPAEPPPPDPVQPASEPAKATPAPSPAPEPLKAEARPDPQEAPPAEPLPPDPDGVPASAQATPVETAEPQKQEPEKTEQENPDPKRFAFFAPLPKMEFDAGAKSSRAPSGNAEATYTSTLYGMIIPLVRVPSNLPPPSRRRPLRVEFVVDGRGYLMASMLSRSSGVPSLDIAALAAVRQAAPFPPTPHGKPLGLVLDFGPQ